MSTQATTSPHKKYIAFSMRIEDATNSSIANAVGLSESTVQSYFSREWKHDYDLFVAERISDLKLKHSAQLSLDVGSALTTVRKILTSKNEKLQLQAAKLILDRGLGEVGVAAHHSANPVRSLLKAYGLDGSYE